MNAKVEAFTRGFFWFGYAVFLSASIPHIAAYFRHFDPVTNVWLENAGYWTIAVLLAVVIDVSDVLVSIAVMKAQANGAKFRDTFGFWVFILLIMTLSWFFNWQYNVVFGTSEFHSVDQNVIWGTITVGQVNPIIGSAFQLLLLVYTGMAHKFAQKPKVISLEDLKKEADEAEKRADYQARIDTVKKAQREQVRHNFFEALKQTKKEVTAMVKGENEETLDGPIDEESLEQPDESNESDETYSSEIEPSNNESLDESQTEVSETSKVPQNGSTAHAYVTLEEAAEMLQYDQSYIKTLRTKKVLKTAGRNSNLVSMASVKAALSKKQSAQKKQMKGKSITTDKLVENPMNAEAMINATVTVLQERPDVTDEELRVILGLKRAESARFWKVKAQSLLKEAHSSEEQQSV